MVIRKQRRVKSRWLVALTGFVMSLGQMPIDQPLATFISLAFLGWLWNKEKPDSKEAMVWGGYLGFPLFSVSFFWIIEPFMIKPHQTGWLAPFALAGMVIFLTSILVFAFYLASIFSKGRKDFHRLLILGVFLTSSELLRSEGFLSFPWGLISATWINTPVAQSLSLFGPYWLSAVTIFSGIILSHLSLGTLTSCVLMISLYVYGLARLDDPVLERSKATLIRVVQPNVKQAEKWLETRATEFFEKQITLSSIQPRSQITIWPETSVTFFPESEPKKLEKISKSIDSFLIFGARRYDVKNVKLYNSAYFLSIDGKIEKIYDKSRLVPFGEYIPLGDLVSKFGVFGLATDGITGFSPGLGPRLVSADGLPTVLMAICYEAIFTTDFTNAKAKAEWILQITNDSWFGKFNGPQQHLVAARMRAIEQGLPLVRSANTGISAIIDPYGRVLGQIRLDQEGVLDRMLPNRLDPTPYAKITGKRLQISLMSLLILTICYLIFKSRINLRK